MATIRPVKKTDFDEIVKYRTQASEETHYVNPPNEKAIRDLIEESTGPAKRRLYYVAISGGHLVGQVIFLIEQEKLCIQNISVLSSMFGSGLARDLMLIAINWAKDNSIPIVELLVRADNVRAIKFYEKFGFEYIKEWRKESGTLVYQKVVGKLAAVESMPAFVRW